MKHHLVCTVVLVLLGQYSSTLVSGQTQDLLQKQLSSSTADFSRRLYQRVAVGKDNVIYSPYSIHSALTMTSTGARGNTLSEMRNVLGLTALGGRSSAAYRDLIVQMNSANNVKLYTANGIFVNPYIPIKNTFINDVSWNYFSTVSNLNFRTKGGPEKAVNNYVAQKTKNMIKDILKKGSIDSTTLMVLVNTIFFNGTWKHQFDEYATRKHDFHLLGGSMKQVDMMFSEHSLRFKRDNYRKADVLEMPFKGDRFSLNILLPHDKEGITDLEKTILIHGVDDIFQDLKSTYMMINIPKFKIETKLNLKDTLSMMGMKRAFNPGRADFTGMNAQGAYIDQVIHKAVIEVKETGTVAAAATAVVMAYWSGPPRTTLFTADHPFLFFLRDSQTGQILFQGKFSG